MEIRFILIYKRDSTFYKPCLEAVHMKIVKLIQITQKNILDVKNFNSNLIKKGFNVKNDLIFNFERKSKVVDDFVQNFYVDRFQTSTKDLH